MTPGFAGLDLSTVRNLELYQYLALHVGRSGLSGGGPRHKHLINCSNELGFAIEQKVQEVIVQKYHGELPVGCAEIVDTNDMRWKYLIAAPTMRIPELIRFTINTYLAFRAILVAIENFNQAHGVAAINSCICPGLGTGVGGVSAATCARQMRAAYQAMKSVARIPSYEAIHEFHSTLLRL